MVLSSTDYFEESFKLLIQAPIEIRSSNFHDCIFEKCKLSESSFINCRFISSSFISCDLSLVQVPGSYFSGVHFEKCKAIGINWAQAYWQGNGVREPIEFRNCALSHSTFLGVDIKASKFIGCELIGVDFRDANLSSVDFSSSDLNKSLFASTDLMRSDLSTARNYQIDPTKNNIKNAKFTMPEVMSLLYSMEIEIEGK